MAILPILCYPDPRLHKVAQPVTAVDERVRAIVDDMFATMYDAHGIGLAATQVDVHERIVVIDVSEERDTPLVLINPNLIWTSPQTHLNEEGCLSVPDYYDAVERPARIRVRYLDYSGQQIEEEIEGLYAVCFQHELDHLNGVLFIDHLSRLRRERAVAKVKKNARLAA